MSGRIHRVVNTYESAYEGAALQHSLVYERAASRSAGPSRNKVVSQIYNVRLFVFSAKRERVPACAGRSILTGRMDSGKRRNDEAPRDTPDTLSTGEQMEEPSSFDESLVRNGRLHRAPYSRRRERDL